MSGFGAPHCGALRAGDSGRSVELYGWVGRRRDHGGLTFVDLRDRWGTVQVVFNPELAPAAHAAAAALRAEFVIKVTGEVRLRPEGMRNPQLATGEVEVAAERLQVLSESLTPPFQLEDATSADTDEKTRLSYRYLDLRRPEMLRILELRHRVNKIIHTHMDENEFIEVETPILSKTSPSGARDFLVPSRLHRGQVYALPQAPQVQKQLLMVAGVQRYYQIARCFRDENLRADRQPEFTQLDIEMSFGDEEDVFSLVEGLFVRLWRETIGVELPLPFPRLNIRDALLRYGTDKPDLRYELEIAELGPVLVETEAKVFRNALDTGGVVRGLAVPGGSDLSRRELDELAVIARGAGGQGLAWLPGGPLDKFLTAAEIAGIQQATGAAEGDLVLIAADRRRRAETVMGLVRSEVARRRDLIRRDEWRFLWINPTYLFDEDDEGRLTYAHHPFVRPVAEDLEFVEERPYDVRAHAYDIVCNGYELGGGSLRIYDPAMQERVFKLLGMPESTIRERFGYLLEAFNYGVPPHGGIAWGVDRVVMMLAGTENIRDVIAFPKTQSMTDLMMEAPSAPDPELMEELGLRFAPPPGTSRQSGR
ncbi:MAG: aspartate--tRNA ligase [Candidatus Dormibacter sp.]|uniref:aspartate--tRNA ligase n=1 Tax=Candidatus Dormibacter sp. TaxID=2973982 RepID=UPI000DB3EC7F|nr:MAG: aspartate--tRNA ligase [Candidatus Dormibacteraeota bacterium]